VFLVLYVLVIISLVAKGLSTGHRENILWTLICLVVLIVSHILFIWGSGTIEICRPIKRHRLFLPILVASFMLTILVASLFMSFMELFRIEDMIWTSYVFWALMVLSWVAWGFLLYIYTREIDLFPALKRLTKIVFTGSLLELLASVPSHIIVSRRPGCFVGFYTYIGIIGGFM
jgi:hypothetical protein